MRYAQPTGAEPIILMVETYSECADAIQNMAIRGPAVPYTKPTCPQSDSEVRTSYTWIVRTYTVETYSTAHLSGASPLQGQWGGWEVDCRRRTANPSPLFLAIRSQSRVTVGPPVETDPAGENAVMLRSRPLAGDNGSTHLLSDVYYIQVHLSFRGSWPRVTPRATKPDCGAEPNRYRYAG